MTGTKEILVGLNDSNSSRAALGWAAYEAGSAELPLHVVHVVDWSIGILAYGVQAEEGVIPEAWVRPSCRRGIRRCSRRSTRGLTGWWSSRKVRPGRYLSARQPSMLVIGGRTLARPANDESGLVGRYCLHHLPGALVVTGEDGGWKPGDLESAMTVRAYNG